MHDKILKILGKIKDVAVVNSYIYVKRLVLWISKFNFPNLNTMVRGVTFNWFNSSLSNRNKSNFLAVNLNLNIFFQVPLVLDLFSYSTRMIFQNFLTFFLSVCGWHTYSLVTPLFIKYKKRKLMKIWNRSLGARHQ